MQKVLKIISLVLAITFLSMYIAACANLADSSRTADSRTADEEQTEQDILKLLEIEDSDAEKPDEKEAESDYDASVSDLERELMERNSEINELKSELVLRDERIEEMRRKISNMESSMPMVSGPTNFNEFSSRYRIALSHYYARRCREGIDLFNELLAIDMNNSLSDNCQYWIGECYYALKNFKKCIIEFEKVFTFSNSNKDDDAQLKLGLCYINLRDKERARSELNRLLTNYPKSEYVEKAKSLLDGL